MNQVPRMTKAGAIDMATAATETVYQVGYAEGFSAGVKAAQEIVEKHFGVAVEPQEREPDEPPEDDGECFRGGEAAAFMAEEQARIQRELK